MKRWDPRKTRLLGAVLAGSLLTGAFAGCAIVAPEAQNTAGTQNTEEGTVEFGDVSNAVMTAVPKVVEVEDLGRSRNGFGYRLELSLVSDSAEPFTAKELDAVVEAIWRALPWEPNTIDITADEKSTEEIVDLTAAAAELEPLSATDVGQAGVSLTGMKVRYGEWAAPE